jgi:hypothetical protein
VKEERHENLTVEEIKERLRTGYQFYPTQPGLKQAARELIRPLMEGMKGREIVYVCRVPKLMRVEQLTVDDEGFRAVARTLHHLGSRILTIAEGASVQKELERFMTIPEYEAELAALPDDDAMRVAWWKQKHQAAVNALPPETKPLNFGSPWAGLRMCGSAICMTMMPACFYPDLSIVAAVKAAVERGDFGGVSTILERAGSQQ